MLARGQFSFCTPKSAPWFFLVSSVSDPRGALGCDSGKSASAVSRTDLRHARKSVGRGPGLTVAIATQRRFSAVAEPSSSLRFAVRRPEDGRTLEFRRQGAILGLPFAARDHSANRR